MAEPTRSLSPWWALLLLPVGLFAGWMVGKMPTPAPPPRAAEAPAAAPSPRMNAPSAGIAVDVSRDAAPRSAPPEPPAKKEEPGEFSNWTSYNVAVSESRRNGKPVLIDFNAEWCGPCQRMKQQLFDDWQHAQVVQTTVIPVSITDRKREDGPNPNDIEELQNRYNVDAFPTLVVFSPSTGRTYQTKGFGDADRTLQWIQEAAKAVR